MNSEKARKVEGSLKLIAETHQTVRGAAKAEGLTEGLMFRIFNLPFYKGSNKTTNENGQVSWEKGSHPPLVDPKLIDAAVAAKPGRVGARKLLSQEQINEILKIRVSSEIRMEALAQKYGVSYATMQRTLKGKPGKVSAKTRMWKENRLKILGYLRNLKISGSSNDVAQALDMELATVQKHLKSLSGDREILRQGSPQKGYIYIVPDKVVTHH
ncbi:MAG TPA: hypothetical protein VFE98_08685 [Candidatus Bathyarchaeia archaeon]|nr:hypothetical protein [Candidatus Bathyarchaeia archaeon]